MLGLIIAVPVLLAMLFLVITAWVSNEATVWILVPPLAVLGAALIVFAVRALRVSRVTVRSLAILGTLELAIVVFLLAASRPITGGTITGAVISLAAACVSFWTAYRVRQALDQPAPAVAASRKPSPISITVRKPGSSPPPAGKPTGKPRSKRKT